MTDEIQLDPDIGDVFACANFDDEHEDYQTPASPTLFDRLLRKLRLLQAPDRHYDIEYRAVVDHSPTTVFYYTADNDCLKAAWRTEWIDWQVQAYLVANAGAELPSDELYDITGSRTLPFNLEAMFGVSKSIIQE